MKKFLVVLVIVLALPASSLALDWSAVLGGAMGDLSASNSVGSYFYAEGGQEIVLIASPMDYSSTHGLMVVATIDNPTVFLKTGYTTNYIYFTAPQSTLYLMACVKSSGLSGDMLIGAIKSGSGMLQSMGVEQQIPEDLLEKARQKILEMTGQ